MMLLLVAIVVLLALIQLTIWAVLYQLVAQRGRLLMRVDTLESRLTGAGLGGAAPGLEMIGVRRGPDGLPVGTPIEPFTYESLDGRPVSLSDFAGKEVLLVSWSPQCGYCDVAAEELARLQSKLRAAGITQVFLSRGTVEANRRLVDEHGLNDATVLLLGDGVSLPVAFRDQGTPAAYLLDREGKVARPLALGYQQVASLAREVAAGAAPDGIEPHANGNGNGHGHRVRLPGEKPLSESKIERNGLKAGTPAPLFRLPGLDGAPVALEDYRGRPVLLVFTDPHCGPCDQIAQDLAKLRREPDQDEPALILVGRGDPEENRRKAEAHGITFPVVVQNRWELSRQYGIFATPVAFLIDEQGVIARDVARGVRAILDLIPDRQMAGRR